MKKIVFWLFQNSLIEIVNYQAVSFLSDLADGKSEIVNSFPNTSYENKLSKVVKLIKKWLTDALKRQKENDKVFYFISMI